MIGPDYYDLQLCADCTLLAVNGDEHPDAVNPLDRLDEYKGGSDLVPVFDTETGEGIEEFAWSGCDGCTENQHKGGSLYAFRLYIEG